MINSNGLLSVDPDRIEGEIWDGLRAAGETDLPAGKDYVDTSVLEDAHAALA